MNKKSREDNKSKGPWGMKNFDFQFRKMGEKIIRDRFINAPDKESAEDQFNFIMKKDGFEVDILNITEIQE